MCYSGCQFENRNGGCKKPFDKLCPSDYVAVCTNKERYCIWLSNDLCDKTGDCKYKTWEKN